MIAIRILLLSIFLLIMGFVIYNFYPEDELQACIVIDKLVVYKAKRQLLAYANGKLVKTYKISLGRVPIGDKEYEGDKKTPEGTYFINDKNPNSAYHRNLGISYPNMEDEENAKRLGKSVGSNIKIHGIRNGFGFIGKIHRHFDWTLGCIALTNNEIDELYEAVELGTVIEIYP